MKDEKDRQPDEIDKILSELQSELKSRRDIENGGEKPADIAPPEKSVRSRTEAESQPKEEKSAKEEAPKRRSPAKKSKEEKKEASEKAPRERKTHGKKPKDKQPKEKTPKEKQPREKEAKEKRPKERKPREKRQLSKSDKKKIKLALMALGAVILVVAVVLIIVFVNKSSANAYLKPYEEKYGISFPDGMLEDYCDAYGENQNLAGFLNYGNSDTPIPVTKTATSSAPHIDVNCDFMDFGFNTVVYGTADQLGDIESAYQDAQACNSTGCFIQYDSLFQKQRWRVLGAFYTNTDPKDDNGYVFPYNVTYEMTQDSYSEFFDRLTNRFMYDTNYTLTKNDKILTVSVESQKYDGFRFVLVCVMQDKSKNDVVAEDNDHPHYPQAICDILKEENPYALSSKWYPEILIKNGEDTSQQNIRDYTK